MGEVQNTTEQDKIQPVSLENTCAVGKIPVGCGESPVLNAISAHLEKWYGDKVTAKDVADEIREDAA